MKYTFKTLCFSSIIMLFMSCISNSQIGQLELITRSPTGCTHVFYLDNNGSGRYIAGIEEEGSVTFELEETIKQGAFTVNHDKMEKILNMVGKIESGIIKTDKAKDAMEYILKVDGKQRIISYARKSEVINILRDIISSSLSKPIDYSCESYIDND